MVGIVVVIVFALIMGFQAHQEMSRLLLLDSSKPETRSKLLTFLLNIIIGILTITFFVGSLLYIRMNSIVDFLKKVSEEILTSCIQSFLIGFVIVVLSYIVNTAIDGSISIMNSNNESIQSEEIVKE